VLAGYADDEHESAASVSYRRREHPRRFVEPGDSTAIGVDSSPLGGAKFRRVQERCRAERSRRIDDMPVARDQLRITLAAFDEATGAVARQGGVRLPHESGEVLRTEPHFPVQ